MSDGGKGPLGIGTDWLLVVVLAVGATASIVLAARWDALTFDQDALRNIGDVMAPLVIIAAFIERAVEVTLTPLRGDQTEDLRARIRVAKRDRADTTDLDAQLRNHRQISRRLAFVLAVGLGLVAALVGLRGLSNLLEDPSAAPAGVDGLDVFLTGLLLGGGADGIHKLVKVITSYTDLITKTNEEKKDEAVA